MLKGLKELMKLALADPVILSFLWNQKAPTYQMARYTDWFAKYLRQQFDENKKYSGIQYYQDRIRECEKAQKYLVPFEKQLAELDALQVQRLEALKQESSFDEAKKQLILEHSDVIKHCPPRYIIGQQYSEPSYVENPLAEYEDSVIQVKLCEL